MGGVASLESLHALTRLVDLRIVAVDSLNAPHFVTASALSGSCSLTRLVLTGAAGTFDPVALAGKTRLQHLDLHRRSFTPDGAAGVAQLLSQLQQLTQLTCLRLADGLRGVQDAYPHIAAYAALTASSKLQCLDISGCTLPGGLWKHVFPAGRLLPHLQSLNIASVEQATGGEYAAAPEGSRLVSCCPGLRLLDMGCCSAMQRGCCS
jgi:hypothetical protein